MNTTHTDCPHVNSPSRGEPGQDNTEADRRNHGHRRALGDPLWRQGIFFDAVFLLGDRLCTTRL